MHDWYFPENFPEKLNSRIQAHTITLVPSANWIKKRWPVEHWKKLITLLSEYHFLILAGPGDTFCEEIRTEAPERVENLAGKTTLLESCYLIHRSHIVVSRRHRVSCMPPISSGIPTLALIGPSRFRFPTGPTAEIFETALSCRPCTKDGSGKCKKGVYQQCMVDIRPETIATRIRQLLPIK